MELETWRVDLEEKPWKSNIVNNLDMYYWGSSKAQVKHQNHVRRSLVTRDLSTFDVVGQVWKFKKRITAISWHQKIPYLLTSADKAGNLILVRGSQKESHGLQFEANKIKEGTGADGAMFSLKYLDHDPSTLFIASLEGTVYRMDIQNPKIERQVFHDFKDYTKWYTSMDICQTDRTVLAGDNKGYARLFTVDGQIVETIQMHKSKIHHCEFNKRDPWLISTASLHTDHEVCLWDVRKLQDLKPLHIFPHKKGATIATFNPLDGSRLLTNDQQDEVRVYQGPLWKNTLTFKHPHRQFQHLTGIRADWHPLCDTIVIGRYPTERPLNKKDVPLRPIEFFDAENGDLISQLQHPVNGIVSLNKFNNTGELLASGMGGNLVLWEATSHLEKLYGGKMRNKTVDRIVTSAQQNALRGVMDDDKSDDDEDEIANLKMKKRKKPVSKESSIKKAKLVLETKVPKKELKGRGRGKKI